MDTSYRKGFFMLMKTQKSIRYIDQLALFKLRGMTGINLSIHNKNAKEVSHLVKQLKTISTLGYYNLKNYALPYYDSESSSYQNIHFDDLVARFYRDKHLKQAVLHAIEDIETTLNTKISNVLGRKYGPYGYLDFRIWCQRNSKNKFLHNKFMDKYAIQKEQLNFLGKIPAKVRKSASYDMRKFAFESDRVNPPIWLLMNELTLGESIHLYKLMSKNNRDQISDYFGCKTDELVSWLDNINLIRNICCHNGLLADFRLKTKAKVPVEFKTRNIDEGILLRTREGNYTNALAFQLCIIVKLMSKINNKYIFKDIKSAVYKLLDDTTTPQHYGFRNKQMIRKLFDLATEDKVDSLVEY